MVGIMVLLLILAYNLFIKIPSEISSKIKNNDINTVQYGYLTMGGLINTINDSLNIEMNSRDSKMNKLYYLFSNPIEMDIMIDKFKKSSKNNKK
jgi:hypothetical protein